MKSVNIPAFANNASKVYEERLCAQEKEREQKEENKAVAAITVFFVAMMVIAILAVGFVEGHL